MAKGNPILIIGFVRNLKTRFTEGRTGRAVSGLAVDYFGNGVTQVLSLLVTPWLVSLLSPSMYGFWIVVTQVIFWLSLLDGGVGMYLIKTIAGSKDRESSLTLMEAISTCFWTYTCLALVAIVIGLWVAPLLPAWVGIEQAQNATARLTFQIAVLTAAVSLVIVATFYAILQGYQQIALVNGIVYGVSITNLLLAVILLLSGWGVEAMALAQLVATVLGGVTAFFLARHFCAFSLSPRFFRFAELKQVFYYGFFFQMNKLAFLANTFSDSFLLAGSLGTASVTTYSLTLKLPQTGSFFVTKVGGALVPGLAELFGQNDIFRLQHIILRLFRLLTRIGILSAIFIVVLNERFVSLWVGPSLFGGFTLTILFAYILLRNCLIGNMSAFFFASGQLQGWGVLSLIEAGVKIGLTVVLLPSLGLLAPAVGTILGGLITGVYAPIKLSRLAQLRLGTLLREGIGLPLLKSLPTVVVLIGLSYLIPTSWHWLGIACIGVGGLAANTLSFDVNRWLSVKAFRVSRPAPVE